MHPGLTIDVAGQPVIWPLLSLLGLGVGFVAGMFGVGGGFILTPALNGVFGIAMPIAVGTALCQKIGTSIGSFLKHRQYQGGEPRIDLYMLGGAVIGTDAGNRLLRRLTALGMLQIGQHDIPLVQLVLQLLYAMLLALAIVPAVRVLRRGPNVPVAVESSPGPLCRVRIPPYVDLPGLGFSSVSVPVLAYIGFATGLLSGLLGIGGGVLLLPVLIYGYGLSMRDAAGTGIVLLFVTVTSGTAIHAWHGTVNLPAALAVLAGSSVGSQLGARTTHRISNRALSLAFILLLSATVVAILVGVGVQLFG